MENLSVYIRVFIAIVILSITWDLAKKQFVPEYIVFKLDHGNRVQPPVKAKAAPQPEGALPATIPKEWEAIFVLVVGYYFAERPKSAALRSLGAGATASVQQVATQGAMQEAIAQSIVAAGLIAATVCLFVENVVPKAGEVHYRDAVDGAWIAGVAIAAGFYFKDPATNTRVDDVVAWARAALAAFMVAATGLMYLYRSIAIPQQWIGLVVLVVTFYFKERK